MHVADVPSPSHNTPVRALPYCFQVTRLQERDHVVPLQPAIGTWRSKGVFDAQHWHKVPKQLPIPVAATLCIKYVSHICPIKLSHLTKFAVRVCHDNLNCLRYNLTCSCGCACLLNSGHTYRQPCCICFCSPPSAMCMLEHFEQLQPGDVVIQNGATSAVGQVTAPAGRQHMLQPTAGVTIIQLQHVVLYVLCSM